MSGAKGRDRTLGLFVEDERQHKRQQQDGSKHRYKVGLNCRDEIEIVPVLEGLMWKSQHCGTLAGVWKTSKLSCKVASWQRCGLQLILAGLEMTGVLTDGQMNLQHCNAWMIPGYPLMEFADS